MFDLIFKKVKIMILILDFMFFDLKLQGPLYSWSVKFIPDFDARIGPLSLLSKFMPK